MADMIANKRMRYGTRRLLPDDGFTASGRDARVLNAIGKARYATRDMVAADKTDLTNLASGMAELGEQAFEKREPADERPALRAEYETKFGKKPFGGWSAETLREKLAAG